MLMNIMLSFPTKSSSAYYIITVAYERWLIKYEIFSMPKTGHFSFDL